MRRAATLQQLCSFTRQTLDPQAHRSEEFEYYSIPAFQAHGEPLRAKGAEILSQKLLVSPGDVLFGKLNPRVPKVWHVGRRGPLRQISSTEFIALTPGSDLDGDYLYFVCRSPMVLALAQRYAGGSTPSRQRVDARLFASIAIQVPSLTDQRRIANILRKIQGAIDIQTRIVGALKELKAAALTKLFHERSDWPTRPLGQLARVGNGSTPSRGEIGYWENGSIPWLPSAKVHEGMIRRADEFVTELALRECHLPLVPPQSIVVAITGQGKTLGNAALVTFETTVNQHLAYMTLLTHEVLPEFLLFCLQSQYEELRRAGRSGGTTKGALTCGYLKTLQIPVPSVDEQQLVSSTFHALLESMDAEEAKLSVLEELFAASLESLMSDELIADSTTTPNS